MRYKLSRSERSLLLLCLLIFAYLLADAAGAEWCRNNYYCQDAQTEQYQNDCAANSWTVFYTIAYCWFHTYKDDINAFATTILAFFTVVLAIATRRQALLTRDAVDIATTHAGHAERAITETKNTGERQLRAYLLVDRADLHDGTTLNPPQPARTNIPGVTIHLKNFGATPAYNVRSWAEIDVVPTAQITRLTHPPLINAYGMTVGPGGGFMKSHWFNRPITPAEINDIATGARCICVYGRIEYIDAFERSRFTDIKMVYINSIYPPIGIGVFYTAETGNNSD